MRSASCATRAAIWSPAPTWCATARSSAAPRRWALRSGGRLVILMTHPCFRVPRQSGWGWDEERKLRFRRVDRYLTPLAVPLKPYAGGRGATRSYHRPLEAYVSGLANRGLLIDRLLETPTYQSAPEGPDQPAEYQH